MNEFPSYSYDMWKTRTPEDDEEQESPIDEDEAWYQRQLDEEQEMFWEMNEE